jgi:hypothetical protein
VSLYYAILSRLVRDDGSSGFVRRAETFAGSVNDALQFSGRILEHFSKVARRVEAWSNGPLDPPEQTDRKAFFIQRHENKRDWRLLESQLTNPGWFVDLHHAVDYAAFRGRGYSFEIRVKDGPAETLIVSGRVPDPFIRIAPG